MRSVPVRRDDECVVQHPQGHEQPPVDAARDQLAAGPRIAAPGLDVQPIVQHHAIALIDRGSGIVAGRGVLCRGTGVKFVGRCDVGRDDEADRLVGRDQAPAKAGDLVQPDLSGHGITGQDAAGAQVLGIRAEDAVAHVGEAGDQVPGLAVHEHLQVQVLPRLGWRDVLGPRRSAAQRRKDGHDQPPSADALSAWGHRRPAPPGWSRPTAAPNRPAAPPARSAIPSTIRPARIPAGRDGAPWRRSARSA